MLNQNPKPKPLTLNLNFHFWYSAPYSCTPACTQRICARHLYRYSSRPPAGFIIFMFQKITILKKDLNERLECETKYLCHYALVPCKKTEQKNWGRKIRHLYAYVSMRQHASAYVQHTYSIRTAYVNIRRNQPPIRMRQHTYVSAYVSIRQHKCVYILVCVYTTNIMTRQLHGTSISIYTIHQYIYISIYLYIGIYIDRGGEKPSLLTRQSVKRTYLCVYVCDCARQQ